MGTRRTSFSIAGVINSTVHSSVFQSTVAQPARLVGIDIAVSAYAGDTIELWIDQDRYQDIYDRNLRTYGVATADSSSNANPKNYLEVDKVLEVGQQVTIAVLSGGTAVNAQGAFVWEDLSERA